MKTIASRDNPTFKALRSLAEDAREQRRSRRTLLDGPHLLAAYLDHGGRPLRLIVSESGRARAEVARLLETCADVEALELRDALFRELAAVVSPVGLLAEIAVPDEAEEPITGDCVLLDAVQDAGNVGAILRTALAAGFRDVVLGAGCAGVWTPKVLRAAQGAHFGLRLREQADLSRFLEAYPGLSLATVARGGVPLFDLDLRGTVAWIVGNEGGGVAAQHVERARRRATIPLAAGCESLNVAAAAAICLFETVRQRRLGS